MTLNTTRPGTPYMYYKYPGVLTFSPFCSMTSLFQDIAHFIIPIDYHVKLEKRIKKCPKIPSCKFHNSFNNFDRDSPQEYMTCGEQIWCILLEEMFDIFTLNCFTFFICNPIWPNLNEKEKKPRKISFKNFEKWKKKCSGDIVNKLVFSKVWR